MPEHMPEQVLEQNPKQITEQNASRPRPREVNSSSVGLAEFQHAQDDSQPEVPDDDIWLVGYRISPGNGTVTLLGFNPSLTEVLRSRRWATLVRDQGWIIPLRYLAHVERLLNGADVALFDVDGFRTPGQRARDGRRDQAGTQAVLEELRAARDAAEADPEATEQAKRECRAAFADAFAALRHGEQVGDPGA